MTLPASGAIKLSQTNTELGYPFNQQISLGSFVGSYTQTQTVINTADVPIYAGTYPVYASLLNAYGVWTNPDFSTPSDGTPQVVNYSTSLIEGGTFTLIAGADNSVQVYIGGSLILSETGYNTTSSATIQLPAGTLAIRVVAENVDYGSPGLFAVVLYDSSNNPVWNTRAPLEPNPVYTTTIPTGSGYVPILAQQTVNPTHPVDMNSLHGKANLPFVVAQALGGYVAFPGYNHGPGQTPTYTLTSQAARPQYLAGTMSVTSAGNNYVRFRCINQTGNTISDSGYIQIGIYAAPTTFVYNFTDIIQPYATNSYYCYCDCNYDGDYNYMKGSDSFNGFTFIYTGWAG